MIRFLKLLPYIIRQMWNPFYDNGEFDIDYLMFCIRSVIFGIYRKTEIIAPN